MTKPELSPVAQGILDQYRKITSDIKIHAEEKKRAWARFMAEYEEQARLAWYESREQQLQQLSAFVLDIPAGLSTKPREVTQAPMEDIGPAIIAALRRDLRERKARLVNYQSRWRPKEPRKRYYPQIAKRACDSWNHRSIIDKWLVGKEPPGGRKRRGAIAGSSHA